MSEQLSFLEKAAQDGVDAAASAYPNAVKNEELPALKALNPEQLRDLKKIREAMEAGDVAMDTGIGIASM